ncbi:very short patch repair endonuclease, partial [bacterium]|nr:very short patch repair endonuclease [bacterium]
MSKIRKKNTRPELNLKNGLRGTYLRYQPKIFGNPDFALKSKKIVIFVDGCFWHKCPDCFRPPKSNKDYWGPKIERNVKRDQEVSSYYQQKGWKVIRIWEHEISEDRNKVVERIKRELE